MEESDGLQNQEDFDECETKSPPPPPRPRIVCQFVVNAPVFRMQSETTLSVGFEQFRDDVFVSPFRKQLYEICLFISVFGKMMT